MMASSYDDFKPCKVGARGCFMSHGHQVEAEMMLVHGAPSFFQQIGVDQLLDTTGFLPVPTRFMVDHGNRLRDIVTLRGPSGWVGQVNLSCDRVYGFRGGWKQFRFYHNIEAGDHLVCTMIAESDFVVKIYDKQGCEKALPFLNPNSEVVSPSTENRTENALHSELSSRSSLDPSIGKSATKLGERCGMSQSEDSSLLDTRKRLCTQEPAPGKFGASNGTVDINIDDQIHAIGKLPENFQARVTMYCSNDDIPVEMEERSNVVPHIWENLISEDISKLESEKSAEMEDGETSKEVEFHREIYEAQLLKPLSKALKAAHSYRTSNPSTMCLINKTAASKSQSYISSKFARRWLPAVKTQLLLIDELDRKWPVMYIPKSYHLALSAGWAKFVRDNNLETGDVVLMELKEPNSFSLVVHIFREEGRTVGKESDISDFNRVGNGSRSSLLRTGNYVDNLPAGGINGDQIIGTSKVDTRNKSPETPLLPQNVPVANLFASRESPKLDSDQKAGTANICSFDSNIPNETERATEGAGVPPDFGKVSQQGGSSMTNMLHESVLAAPVSIGKISPLFQQLASQEGTTMSEVTAVPDISYPPKALPQYVQHVQPIPPVLAMTSQQEFPHDEQAVRPQDKWAVQSRRPREPTEIEKRRTMDRALEFWTPNPRVIASMKPSQVYNGFSINLRSPSLPNETQDVTLLDTTGKTWICKWLVNDSGKRISAGWKKFALDHLLEESDVVVFEVVSCENLTLLAHIFRVELDDSTIGSAEIKQCDDGRRPPGPRKRKRKSRAKVVDLGRPPPNPSVQSEYKTEMLNMSVPPPETGANVLPMASTHRYPILQSQRRPVTMEERMRTELAARTLNTSNPSVVVVLTRSSVYCHFTVTIPSAFAKQWLPKKFVSVTLCDSAGLKSIARWAGNRKKSACLKGFRAFSQIHNLEEGDALVFELMDSNPDNPVFLVHVFRVVELSNSGFPLKGWEYHNKLNVAVCSEKASPSQEFDSDACQLLTDSEDNSESSLQATRPPVPLVYCSSKAQTNARSSTMSRQKRILEENGGSNGGLDSAQLNFYKGLHGTEKAILSYQLAGIGRRHIEQEVMPFLRKLPNMDASVHEFESASRSAQENTRKTCGFTNKGDTDSISQGINYVEGTSTCPSPQTHSCEPTVEYISQMEKRKLRKKQTQYQGMDRMVVPVSLR